MHNKLRDANDSLASTLYEIASGETINASLKKEMTRLAENLATLGDSRDESTQDLDHKVVVPLSQYGTFCRNAKAEVRNICGAKQKETCKRRQLGKMREKTPSNIRQIMKAETDLAKACTEVSLMQKALEEHCELFERKKLTDIKNFISEFIKAELSFHVEAVQILSKAYKDFEEFNVEHDFKDFKKILQQNPSNSRLATVIKNSPKDQIGNPRIQDLLGGYVRPIRPPRSAKALIQSAASTQDDSERTLDAPATSKRFSYDETSESETTQQNQNEIDDNSIIGVEELEKDYESASQKSKNFKNQSSSSEDSEDEPTEIDLKHP